jgi:hypothetical protein
MSQVTYYVALPFVFTDDGLSPGVAVECISASAAILQAETLSMVEGHAGAVAFSRTGDPGAGKFKDATVLKKFGDVPDDLSAL